MAGLRLFLFGTPRLERDGDAVDLETRKAMALLAYLAVTGQAHAREALAGLLWPDFDQPRALANLRRTLWALNKSKLGDLVEADGETVRLNPGAGLWVDATRVEVLPTADARSHTVTARLYLPDDVPGVIPGRHRERGRVPRV